MIERYRFLYFGMMMTSSMLHGRRESVCVREKKGRAGLVDNSSMDSKKMECVLSSSFSRSLLIIVPFGLRHSLFFPCSDLCVFNRVCLSIGR